MKPLRHALMLGLGFVCYHIYLRLSADAIDVRTFGAVGDGVADDSAAIQAALADASKDTLARRIRAWLLAWAGFWAHRR